MIHLMAGGDKGIVQGHYDSAEDFWTDLTTAYRAELAALAAAGATYIQLDDTSIAFLCDPTLRPTFERWGHDPDRPASTFCQKMSGFADVLSAGLRHGFALAMAAVYACRQIR